MKIALLGIDGSGKSSLSVLLKKHFEAAGKTVIIIPFHKWVFADVFRDKLKIGKLIDKNRKQRKTSYYAPSKKSLSSFVKPPIALIDNIVFYLLNKPKRKNEVFIYDRFICATQIKLAALNYRAKWLKPIWQNIQTDLTFVIDIDPELSLKRQISRNDPYTYPTDILKKEREMYLSLAERKGFVVIKNNKSVDEAFEAVLTEIKKKNNSLA